MSIKKTYSFRNGAKVLLVEDWAGPTRYSGTVRYFAVVDPKGVDHGHEYDRWEDARQEALSYREGYLHFQHYAQKPLAGRQGVWRTELSIRKGIALFCH